MILQAIYLRTLKVEEFMTISLVGTYGKNNQKITARMRKLHDRNRNLNQERL